MPLGSAPVCGMLPTDALNAARHSASVVRCMKAVNGCEVLISRGSLLSLDGYRGRDGKI
jgi:hypothetical protein